MSRNVEVKLDEVRRVFDMLENVNDLFHQPLKYQDSELIERFARQNYQEISDLYYKVVWNWLPDDAKDEIENQ